MFRLAARELDFELANGRHIVVRGRVSLYEARGEFQLVVDSVEEAGEGLLRRRFDELKKKLAAEGLFDAARKRVPPRLPRRIGVVTSPTGAALRDVLIALRRRFPAIPVLIYPTAVQGTGAAEEISRALKLADKRADCDLLILTRGGGSLEDLWAFNEEVLARTIAAVELPIICGVGHEIDFTIADFVADLRAPTPSQAAEDQREWRTRLARLAQQLAACTRRKLQIERRLVGALEHRLNRCHPGVHLRELGQRLDEIEVRLQRGIERTLAKRRARLARCATAVAHANPAHQLAKTGERLRWAREHLQRALVRRLDGTRQRVTLAQRALTSLSPLATLERGYAIVAHGGTGHVVTDAGTVTRGDSVAIRLARGTLNATIDEAAAPTGED